MATNGLVVMTPTSVAKTGASSTATINADGSVTFGSCETLSLNGVFTGDYDNYMVTTRHLGTTADNALMYKLRASGTDTSTNYNFQYLQANSTTISAARATSQTSGRISTCSNVTNAGFVVYFFGPYLAQPTAWRSAAIEGVGSPRILDWAGTHSTSSAYDGFTLIPDAGTFSGLLTVFGFNQ